MTLKSKENARVLPAISSEGKIDRYLNCNEWIEVYMISNMLEICSLHVSIQFMALLYYRKSISS